MKSMSILILVVFVFSLSSTVVSGDENDCPSVRTIVETACHDSCSTELMYQVCMDTLRDKFHMRSINEVGEYGERAAEQAVWAYRHTSDYVGYLQHNPTLSGEERAVYSFCEKELSDEAHEHMVAVAARLPHDCFDLSDEYKKALQSVEACRDRVAKLPSSPLLAMVKVDLNKTLLVGYLLKLIGVKW